MKTKPCDPEVTHLIPNIYIIEFPDKFPREEKGKEGSRRKVTQKLLLVNLFFLLISMFIFL